MSEIAFWCSLDLGEGALASLGSDLVRAEPRLDLRLWWFSAIARRQHRSGEFSPFTEILIAQRTTGHGLPVIISRQRHHPVTQRSKPQAFFEQSMDRRYDLRLLTSAMSHSRKVKKAVCGAERHDPTGQITGDTCCDERLCVGSEVICWFIADAGFTERGDRAVVATGNSYDIERLCFVTE